METTLLQFKIINMSNFAKFHQKSTFYLVFHHFCQCQFFVTCEQDPETWPTVLSVEDQIWGRQLAIECTSSVPGCCCLLRNSGSSFPKTINRIVVSRDWSTYTHPYVVTHNLIFVNNNIRMCCIKSFVDLIIEWDHQTDFKWPFRYLTDQRRVECWPDCTLLKINYSVKHDEALVVSTLRWSNNWAEKEL